MKNNTRSDVTATIDRREGRSFVLIFSDSQELIVPVHFFAREAREGDVIHLRFFTHKQASADKAELARHLLEEILNGK